MRVGAVGCVRNPSLSFSWGKLSLNSSRRAHPCKSPTGREQISSESCGCMSVGVLASQAMTTTTTTTKRVTAYTQTHSEGLNQYQDTSMSISASITRQARQARQTHQATSRYTWRQKQQQVSRIDSKSTQHTTARLGRKRRESGTSALSSVAS